MAKKDTKDVAGLTVQDKVMLHLYRLRAFSDAFEVPGSICQPGIAKGVGVRRSHISIVLKGLRDKGLGEERMAHVHGEKRRKKVYQLTAKGKDGAARIMDRLEAAGVPIDTILAPLAENGGPNATAWKVPEIKYFFGRSDELSEFKAFLADDGPRIFAIQGLPGIGKTTFLSYAVQPLKGRKDRHVFWFTFKEWSGLQNLLGNLSTFLSEMGVGGLSKALGKYGTGPIDIDAVANAVLEAGTLLLVLDDVHLVDAGTAQFLKAIVLSEARSGLKVALAGRALPQFFSLRDSKVKGRVQELKLEGLGPEDGAELYKAVAHRDDFKDIYPLSKGHPLSIELIGLAGGSTADSQRFIFEEIYKVISDEERAVMRAASVFREPVPAEGLFIEKGVTFQGIDGLLRRGLLRTIDGSVRAHELVRDFFYERMSTDERKALHTAATSFYLEHGGDDRWLEAHYHMIRAGQGIRSAKLLMTRASELLRKGHHEAIKRIADELEAGNGGDIGDRLVDVLKVRAEILHLHGKRDDALRTCERLLNVAKAAGDRASMVQGQILRGAIAYESERWDDAVNCYKEALSIAEELDDQDGMAKAYNNLGILYWRLHNIGEAVRCYDRSIAIAEQRGDRPGIARIKANLGIIHMEGGDCDRAQECFEASLALSEELGDKKTAAILYGNLGELHQKEGRAQKAHDCYSRSLELAEEVGFKQQSDEARKGLASLRLRKGTD